MYRAARRGVLLLPVLALVAGRAGAVPPASVPRAVEGDFVLPEFRFASGETLRDVRIHYRTLGTPARNAAGRIGNAVLLLHGTGGSGAPFLGPGFGGLLFGEGQPLDASKYFVVVPDAIGHGGSSKPSDGLKGRFPRYTYDDMVELERRLLVDRMGIDHLRLVMGTSMGGMHTWLWGTSHPEAMDALFPLASTPVAIAGRNRIWRKLAMDSIRDDPGWRNGEYAAQPSGLRGALALMLLVLESPWHWQKEAPTAPAADAAADRWLKERLAKADADDLLWALDASRTYDPEPLLPRVTAPVVAVNFADDVINPPELGLLERAMAKVKRGKAVVVPLSESTHGHVTHSHPEVWIPYLKELLAESEPPR